MKLINNSSKYKILNFRIILLLGFIFIGSIILSGVVSATAVNSSTIYVSSHGNNSWNGLYQNYTNGINGPKLTIGNATGTVTSDGTIYIANGTYKQTGDYKITIPKNMTIIGASQQNTIINGQQKGTSIFKILTGINVTFKDLTLTNGTAPNGGAIYNLGELNITNCTFTGNFANRTSLTTGFGGAIYNNGTLTAYNCSFNYNNAYDGGGVLNEGTMTESNNTFYHNIAGWYGGAICSDGKLRATNDLFAANSAGDYGGAINCAGQIIVINSRFLQNLGGGSGGAICNGVQLTITNCTLQNNTASSGGAIQNYGNITITNNLFTKNTAKAGGAICNIGLYGNATIAMNNSTLTNNNATNGGAMYNYCINGNTIININNCILVNNTATDGGAVYNNKDLLAPNGNYANDKITIEFSRIVGNTATKGDAIYSNASSVNAKCNWWGSNNNPANNVYGNVAVNPWLVLALTVNPNIIRANSTSTIAADLLHDSNGTVHDPASGHVPDGIPATFTTTTLGSIGSTSSTVNGTAKSTLNGGLIAGVANVSATIDNQTVNKSVTIDNTQPSVKTINPANNSVNIQINQAINVAFSEPIKAGNMFIELKIIMEQLYLLIKRSLPIL